MISYIKRGGCSVNFLQKLDFMMERFSLNKRTLSQNSGIPYTTIDGWYKKGYEGMKIPTLRALSDYFNTVLEYWVLDDVTDPNYWKANGFVVNTEEMEHVQKYRLLDGYGKEAVDSILEVEHRRCVAAAKREHEHARLQTEESMELSDEEIVQRGAQLTREQLEREKKQDVSASYAPASAVG